MRVLRWLFLGALCGPLSVVAQDAAPETVENMVFEWRADSGTLAGLATGGIWQSEILGVNGTLLRPTWGGGYSRIGHYRWSKISQDSGWLEYLATDGQVLFRYNLVFFRANVGRLWGLYGHYGLVPDNPSRDKGQFGLRPFSTAVGVPLRNGSVQVIAGPGRPARLGFVVAGAGLKQVLVRAIGPSLARFGTERPARDLVLKISKHGKVRATNRAWEPSDIAERHNMRLLFDRAGAFALDSGSGDCALVLDLEDGDFVAEADAQFAGEVLIEFFLIE